jgi:hypothetical protein
MCDTTCEIVFNFEEKDYPGEWQKMWDELRYAYINRRRKVDPFSGEFQWQYVGVVNYEDKGLNHFFTHKKHPVTLRNEYYCVPLSEEMRVIVERMLAEKKFEEEKEKPIEIVLGQKIELVLV